jgi:hypothetical protein
MKYSEIIDWLLEGDPSIRYQTYRDILDTEKPELRKEIAASGWGREFLARRNDSGHWGLGFYQPKWISSHYTLLDLRNLDIPPDTAAPRETIGMILEHEKAPDGGVDPSKTIGRSDVCVNGMFLDYAAYFKTPAGGLESVADFLLSQRMPDGGFNCRSTRSGAVHSSLHSTLSVAEGILEYRRQGYTYRADELARAEESCREFILLHQLYRSDKTGEIIDRKMLKIPYPTRWKYDILRCLDYFQAAGVEYDERMDDALDVLEKKRRKDGRWPLQANHPGALHFEMEEVGKPSRWNTLRALRVLRRYGGRNNTWR